MSFTPINKINTKPNIKQNESISDNKYNLNHQKNFYNTRKNNLGNFPIPENPEIPQYSDNSKVKFDEIISNMQKYLNQYIKMGLYSNALFYAEKVFFLTLKKEEEILNILTYNNPQNNYNPVHMLYSELFDFANCLFLNKEYFRCVNIIQKYNMSYFNIQYLNLLGQALFSCEDYDSVIVNLDKNNITYIQSKEDMLCENKIIKFTSNFFLKQNFRIRKF